MTQSTAQDNSKLLMPDDIQQATAREYAPAVPVSKTKEEEIPYERAVLPSRGIVYPVQSPLYKQSFVYLKAMTTKEENILTSRALLKNGTVITELMKSVLVEKTVNPREMLIGDRTSLLISIRITGYGAGYEAEIACPTCERKMNHMFDLSQVRIKALDLAPVTEGENLFEFKLPRSKRNVQFRFLTGADEEEISLISERMKKSGALIDGSMSLSLEKMIVSIDGISDRQKVRDAVDKMLSFDSSALREYIDEYEPGIDTMQEIECTCGAVEESTMPIGITFLWPHARKRKRV